MPTEEDRAVMFAMDQLDGTSLPEGTLVLTFDDGPGETLAPGPGPRTMPVAELLADQGIQATFFQCGKHLADLPWVPDALRALGHTVGNHSYAHPHLPQLPAEEAANELARTHPLLGQAEGVTTFFRPPYGEITPELSRSLNAHLPMAKDYIGPVYWDVNVDDWSFWQRSLSPRACADAFLHAIERVGRGIVLMHDSTADLPDVKAANQAFAMLGLLVPELKAKGYEFAPLEAVPDIAALVGS